MKKKIKCKPVWQAQEKTDFGVNKIPVILNRYYMFSDFKIFKGDFLEYLSNGLPPNIAKIEEQYYDDDDFCYELTYGFGNSKLALSRVRVSKM